MEKFEKKQAEVRQELDRQIKEGNLSGEERERLLKLIEIEAIGNKCEEITKEKIIRYIEMVRKYSLGIQEEEVDIRLYFSDMCNRAFREQQSQRIKDGMRYAKEKMDLKELREKYRDNDNFNEWTCSMSIEREGIKLEVRNEEIEGMKLLPSDVYRFVMDIFKNKETYYDVVFIEKYIGRWYISFTPCKSRKLRRNMIDKEAYKSLGLIPLKEEVSDEIDDLIEKRKALLHKYAVQKIENIMTIPCRITIRGKIKNIKGDYLLTPNSNVDKETLLKIVDYLKKSDCLKICTSEIISDKIIVEFI